MVKLQYANRRYFISLPRDLVESKAWRKGDKLVLMFNERGNIEITKAIRPKKGDLDVSRELDLGKESDFRDEK